MSKFSIAAGINAVLRFTAIMLILCLFLVYAFDFPITVQDVTIYNIFWWIVCAIEFYSQGVKHGRQKDGHEDDSSK